MKILQINPYYYRKSGSEVYVFNVSSLLKERGHQVIPFAMQHEKNRQSVHSEYFVENIDYERVIKRNILEKIRAGSKAIYSLEARNKLSKLINKENPNIAHLHKINNTLTPSVLCALKEKGVPVVQTLHDYRLVCPSYSMYDPNRFEVCEACKGHKYFNAVKRKCQKSSFVIGLNIAMESYLYYLLRTYQKNIDLFISPSVFLMRKVIEFGADRDKIVHIPNFVKPNEYAPNYRNSGYILYFGRLERHKGVKTLVEAMKHVKTKLFIAGEGSYRDFLEEYVKKNNIGNVSFFGFITRNNLLELIRSSLFTVLPSEWYEPFGMTILESFALGKPVIGAKIGGIQELIDNEHTGMLFNSGNVDDLTEKINYLLNKKGLVAEMGRNARKEVEERYNENIHYEMLMEAYNKVL